MSTPNSLGLPLLEELGIGIIQQAAAALGPGVLTIGDDGSGLSMDLDLSGSQSINVEGLSFGPPGLSGRVFIDGISDSNPLSASLFEGFTFGLTAFDVTLANGGVAASHIGGQLTIPFFTDQAGNPETLDVELGFKSDGSFSVTLAAQTTNTTTPDGLVQLIYKISDTVTVELDVSALEIDKAADGTVSIVLSGTLLITTADLSWPSFDFQGLGIDSKGNISLSGGWINLPSDTALDFYGFHLALQRLGFGSDSSGRWIGFNGDIHLVEGLSLGGSVRGLRINLETGALSLDGVGISFEIPGVLSIDGEIDFIKASTPADLANAGLMPSIAKYLPVNIFAGQVDVVIKAADGLEVDAHFIVGNFGGFSVFFLDLDVELPVGIPIFLDVSLYGLQGLVAVNLEPNPASTNKTWWEWYKYPTDATGIDTSATADYDATDVFKWLNYPSPGAFAIGAGATIGTSADDGFTVSAAITLVVMLPGPVISLIGKANILSKRIGSAQQDANFEAMATYDGNAGTFDLTIDAQYQIPVVLDIEGTAELYVDATAGEWYFALGEPPHAKRLKARIFDIFETDAYFVISDKGLVTGTWTGYSSSWSFGPLSVSLDAYLATLAAIQWSPLQIAGGIELHGDVHLSAFGIGFGLTADALLEGCAPNPFWIHGEFQVELDLPWPLPNVGATVSFSWGGDDGSVPPAPLALSHIDATLIDHADASGNAASDHYTLLAHRPGGIYPDATVQYDDPNKPGILWLNDSSPQAVANATAWHNRVDGKDPTQILPDLTPNKTSLTQLAPVVPQDAHFTLNFAHPVVDNTVQTVTIPESSTPVPIPYNSTSPSAANWPKEIVTVTPPSIVGADDMSNINPNPPSVQWLYQHSLKQVAIYEWQAGAWQVVCSIPPQPTPGPTLLNAVWLSPDKADSRQVQMQLKLYPYSMLPGQTFSASWDASSSQQAYGSSFTDQGLQFSLGSSLSPAAILKVAGAPLPGLGTTLNGTTPATLRIQFPSKMQLSSITSLIFLNEGELIYSLSAPTWLGDGSPIMPSSSTQDPTNQWFVQEFDDTTPAIQELSVELTFGTLILYNLNYQAPGIPMAILPDAPRLYAIKVVTSIEAGRVNGGTPNYQTLGNSSPIVEFAYFQTASGPGTGIIGLSPLTPPPEPPSPAQAAPYPQLALNCQNATLPPSNTSSGQTQGAAATPSGQQPASAFPLGGALEELTTYTQWSWPLDGAAAAYYGYDVNVEFVESYVNALYICFSNHEVANSLHFRCADRNQLFTILLPIDIHVPSIPEQSALVAEPQNIPLPTTIVSPSGDTSFVISRPVQSALAIKAQRDNSTTRPDPAPSWLPTGKTSARAAASTLVGRGAIQAVDKLDPGLAGIVLQDLSESAAATAAQAIWFKPLSPLTRYTLDVVAGPLQRDRDSRKGDPGTLEAIFTAPDAITAYAALEAYYTYENSLTTLLRVQFTTSRYATFTDQFANIASQIQAGPGATPIRHYVAQINPISWLGNPSNSDSNRTNGATSYLNSHSALAAVVANFSPLADNLQSGQPPGPTPAASGSASLVSARAATTTAWDVFSTATAASFDGLIAALGRPDLVSTSVPPPVPDSELSLFTNKEGNIVLALLFESPEPAPWQRIWQWFEFTPSNASTPHLIDFDVIWREDGTRGLIVFLREHHGTYQLSVTFQGDIGAEAPCITLSGDAVNETTVLGSLGL